MTEEKNDDWNDPGIKTRKVLIERGNPKRKKRRIENEIKGK